MLNRVLHLDLKLVNRQISKAIVLEKVNSNHSALNMSKGTRAKLRLVHMRVFVWTGNDESAAE